MGQSQTLKTETQAAVHMQCHEVKYLKNGMR